MANLLEIKAYLEYFYGKYEAYILPVLKFLLSLCTLLVINAQLGYMSRLNSVMIVLIVALLCSFLPTVFMLLFSSLFILLHIYSLSMEAAAVMFCLFLVMYLMYFRFCPRDVLAVLFTPLSFVLHIPYVMPLTLGLLSTPASAVSVGCGTVAYYMMRYISENDASLSSALDEDSVGKFRFVLDGLIDNKRMMVMLAAFTITIVLVYVLRRLSVDYAWTIAIIAGTLTDVVVILIGDLMYDTNVSVFGALLASVVSAAIAVLLQFFVFNLDYRRTEKVQFEDDEYYYYVKAVPKLAVPTREKTVKSINAKRHVVPTERRYESVREKPRASAYADRSATRQAARAEGTDTGRGTQAVRSDTAVKSAVEQLRRLQSKENG